MYCTLVAYVLLNVSFVLITVSSAQKPILGQQSLKEFFPATFQVEVLSRGARVLLRRRAGVQVLAQQPVQVRAIVLTLLLLGAVICESCLGPRRGTTRAGGAVKQS